MAKTISITYKGEDYTLEYTRRSVEQMEKQGFVIADIGDKPMSFLTLFEGAFIAHHPKVRRSLTDEIYAAIPNKEAFIECLAEMYSEPLDALMAEPEGEEGNASWGASWR